MTGTAGTRNVWTITPSTEHPGAWDLNRSGQKFSSYHTTEAAIAGAKRYGAERVTVDGTVVDIFETTVGRSLVDVIARLDPDAAPAIDAARAAGHEFRAVIFEGHVLPGCTCGWDETSTDRHDQATPAR